MIKRIASTTLDTPQERCLVGNLNRAWMFFSSEFSTFLFVVILVLTGVFLLQVSSAISKIFLSSILIIVSLIKIEIGILCLLTMTSSIIFEERLPVIETVIGNFHIPDLILLSFLGLIPLRLLMQKSFKWQKSDLNLPLFVFYGAALLSVVLAITNFGVTLRHALSELRIITCYGTFFIVTHFIRGKSQIQFLIRGMFAIATVVSIFMMTQAILGESVVLIPARIEQLVTLGQSHSNVTRVIPPGHILVFCMFLIGACVCILKKFKASQMAFWALVFLLALGVLVGFNRAVWVAAYLSLWLFCCIIPRYARIKFLYLAFLSHLLLAVAFFYAHHSGGRLHDYTTATFERAASLFSGKQLYEKGTLADRLYELGYAIPKIKTHPILGIGLGNIYLPDVKWLPRMRAYIHNGYLWILLKTGLVGFIPFMWLSVIFLVRGFTRWKRITDDYFKSISIGLTLVYSGMMFCALVAPVFMHWNATPLIGVIFGLNEVILKRNPVSTVERISPESVIGRGDK